VGEVKRSRTGSAVHNLGHVLSKRTQTLKRTVNDNRKVGKGNARVRVVKKNTEPASKEILHIKERVKGQRGAEKKSQAPRDGGGEKRGPKAQRIHVKERPPTGKVPPRIEEGKCKRRGGSLAGAVPCEPIERT